MKHIRRLALQLLLGGSTTNTSEVKTRLADFASSGFVFEMQAEKKVRKCVATLQDYEKQVCAVLSTCIVTLCCISEIVPHRSSVGLVTTPSLKTLAKLFSKLWAQSRADR